MTGLTLMRRRLGWDRRGYHGEHAGEIVYPYRLEQVLVESSSTLPLVSRW